MLSGLAPALQAPVTGIAARFATATARRATAGKAGCAPLVTGEVALSFLLLVGAGLLIRSFTQLMRVNRGFQTENRLVFAVSLPDAYWEKGVGKQFLDRFFERLRRRPSDCGGRGQPPSGRGRRPRDGYRSAPVRNDRARRAWASWRVVTPGYFRAVGLPLLKGRLFDEATSRCGRNAASRPRSAAW